MGYEGCILCFLRKIHIRVAVEQTAAYVNIADCPFFYIGSKCSLLKKQYKLTTLMMKRIRV